MLYTVAEYINNSLHSGAKIRSDICPRTLSVPRSEPVSFEVQIMSKDKSPSIFSRQMRAIVFIILQIFFTTRAALKFGEYPRIFPSFSWRIFGHVTRLNQSHANENN